MEICLFWCLCWMVLNESMFAVMPNRNGVAWHYVCFLMLTLDGFALK
jgi:hypothetical protein